MKRRTVYITQIPSRREADQWTPTVDVNPAKEYGDLSVLFPAGMNHSGIGPEQHAPLQRLAAQFDPDTDHLLPMGDPLLMCAAAAVLGAELRDTAASAFRMLKWDRLTRRYISSRIDLP